MLYLKCTTEVQKALGLRKDSLVEAKPTPALLGNWYVHRFELGPRKFHLFMSETTLLSFILFQDKKPVTVESLPNMLLGGLQQLLKMGGLPERDIDNALAHYRLGAYARTDSRSSLGSMNDLVHCYRQMIEFQGGMEACDLTGIIMKMNDMPQRKLQGKGAWHAVLGKLSVFCRHRV